jgi:flagellar motor protein MotB
MRKALLLAGLWAVLMLPARTPASSSASTSSAAAPRNPWRRNDSEANRRLNRRVEVTYQTL